MAQTKREYHMSPFGEAVHPWLNRPDTKFNEGGVFKVGLRLRGEIAQSYMAKVKVQSDRYFEEVTAEMTPGERKKWTVYYPFEEVEDDNGDKTGEVVFDFKQNHTLRLKSGEEKKVQLRLQDGAGKDTTRAIMGGSELRTMYAFRDIKMVSTKQAGVRLDFCGAQVMKFSKGSSGGGFGAVEGYEDDGMTDDAPGFGDAGTATSGAAASGDY